MDPSPTADATAAAAANDTSLEPLACVACRTRKLKCSKTKPVCDRCAKANDGVECVYPESRRKPMSRRRNAKDLEARLAQVEDLLKDVPGFDRKRPADGNGPAINKLADRTGAGVFSVLAVPDTYKQRPDEALGCGSGDFPDNGHTTSELVDLGMSEAPPPFDVVEELHKSFFEKQQMYIPIIHAGRYFKAYHSAPHLRPPMALQYSIWALSAQVHPKYGAYQDIFYRRARQYLEADEMRGHGEYFITIAHAQAWALISTYEARSLLFTRAGMSCARCARLIGMMGLNRLDDKTAVDKIASTLPPPADWTELEERRRVFWGAFCIDSHASISTGWPKLLNASEATTHLPSSEEAFDEGREETASTIENAFAGSRYSTFSSAIIVCHLFSLILAHVQVRQEDRPDDFEHGPFWKRHRELDTKVSSAFVFLPERYRLPGSLRDPVAVHVNLNMHAAVICLHNAARERAEAYNLPPSLIRDFHERQMAASREIVNIMKLTSHMAASYKTPLASMSLYCTTSVFIHQAMIDVKSEETSTAAAESTASNIEYVVRCMEKIARNNNVTRLFLHQAVLDIERNGLALASHFSWFQKYRNKATETGHYVPLIARSAISKHSWTQLPLPGKLPLNKNHNISTMTHPTTCCPVGAANPCDSCRAKYAAERARRDAASSRSSSSTADADLANKRRRMQSPESGAYSAGSPGDNPRVQDWHNLFDTNSAPFTILPDRTASPAASSRRSPVERRAAGSNMPTTTTANPPGTNLGAGMFDQIQIFDPWTGPPSNAGNASNAHNGNLTNGNAFTSVADLPALPTDNAGLEPRQADGSNFSLDAAFMYSQINEAARASGFDTPSMSALTDAAGNAEGADAWAAFIQSGDFNSAIWNIMDENPN